MKTKFSRGTLGRSLKGIERLQTQLLADPPPVDRALQARLVKAADGMLAMVRAAEDLQASTRAIGSSPFLRRTEGADFCGAVGRWMKSLCEIWGADTVPDREQVCEALIRYGQAAHRSLEKGVAGATRIRADHRKHARRCAQYVSAPADPVCVDNSFWHDPKW